MKYHEIEFKEKDIKLVPCKYCGEVPVIPTILSGAAVISCTNAECPDIHITTGKNILEAAKNWNAKNTFPVMDTKKKHKKGDKNV